MLSIGYFDDENREYENYKKDFLFYEINLIKVEIVNSKAELLNYILVNRLDALIIDYDLNKFRNPEFKDGNEIIRYLNIEIPDFPSIILTSYLQNSQDEKTVVNNLIFDRDVLTNDTDSDDYAKVIGVIKNAIEVFRKRMALNQEEFKELFKKKESGILPVVQENRMISLYKLLYAYNEIDEINPELLRNELDKSIDKIITGLQKLIGD